MDGSGQGAPVIALPERLERRMRLGPFPSSRDAVKFAGYAAAGGLLSPFASPAVWLPVIGVGFLLSVWRPDDQAVDERVLALVAWKLRSALPRTSMTESGAGLLVRQGLLQLPSRRHVAVVRTGGTPVAYLPPEELARRFELFRELLRSTDSSLVWMATAIPIRSQAVRPLVSSRNAREALACSGYTELVSVLCRRRMLRRIYLVIGTPDISMDGIARLEGRVANLLERLSSLGVRPIRLRDRALAEAARRFGWPVEMGAG